MEGSIECFDTLICSGARRLTGYCTSQKTQNLRRLGKAS